MVRRSQTWSSFKALCARDMVLLEMNFVVSKALPGSGGWRMAPDGRGGNVFSPSLAAGLRSPMCRRWPRMRAAVQLTNALTMPPVGPAWPCHAGRSSPGAPCAPTSPLARAHDALAVCQKDLLRNRLRSTLYCKGLGCGASHIGWATWYR